MHQKQYLYCLSPEFQYLFCYSTNLPNLKLYCPSHCLSVWQMVCCSCDSHLDTVPTAVHWPNYLLYRCTLQILKSVQLQWAPCVHFKKKYCFHIRTRRGYTVKYTPSPEGKGVYLTGYPELSLHPSKSWERG